MHFCRFQSIATISKIHNLQSQFSSPSWFSFTKLQKQEKSRKEKRRKWKFFSLKDVLVMLVVHKQRWWQLYALNFSFFLLSYQWKVPFQEWKEKCEEKNFPLFFREAFSDIWKIILELIYVLFYTHNSQTFPHNPHKKWLFSQPYLRPCSIQVDKKCLASHPREKEKKKFGTRKKFQFQFNPQSNVKLSLKIP